MILFNTKSKNKYTNWRIVDDVVMGGKSNGHFKVNDDGHVDFYGKVSLENNGGFSMIQYTFDTKNVTSFSAFSLKLKGDGKTYQFRVKTNIDDKHSYTTLFKTNGKWQTIEIPFKQLKPAFRGKKLDMENYSGQQIDMIAFLIGNKKAEVFKLEIESIELVKKN